MHADSPSPVKAGRSASDPPSLPEVYQSVAIPRRRGFWGFFRKLFAFSGPGYLVAVGYMDPGNWATDLAGGSRYNYTLLSVVLISSLLAILLQHLALKLGVVTGLDLAQACRASYHPVVNFFLWIACEIAIVACDLAEVIGAAIALNLLFGLPLLLGVGLTALDVLIIVFLQGRGFRWIEALVVALIAVIGLSFLIEIILARPEWKALALGCLPAREIFTQTDMFYIAIGILGATVMPHNLYLHSSLAQTRNFAPTPAGKREAIWFGTLDSTFALTLSLFINAAILVLAAATFYRNGRHDVVEIQDAYELLTPLLGAGFASTLFAVALLASGQNSTLTGTLAGQIVLEGFLRLKLPPLLQRLVTRAVAIVPVLIVVALMGASGTTRLLVFSQVILSFQLSFAVVPLVQFTGDRRKMGEFVNAPWLNLTAWLVAVVIAVLNAGLIYQTFSGKF